MRVRVHRDGGIFVGDGMRWRKGGSSNQVARFPVRYRLVGGSTPVHRAFRDTQAVEYLHADFGHYFITGLAQEIENLDTGFPAVWLRTGRVFRVWTEGGGGAVPVCRFFSDQSFVPKR